MRRRHREFFNRRKAGARRAPALLVLFALCAALIPSSRAQDARPRRVNATQAKAVTAGQQAAQQQATQQATQQKGTPTAQTGARPVQTPTPPATPQTQPTAGRPKLQTAQSAQHYVPKAKDQ